MKRSIIVAIAVLAVFAFIVGIASGAQLNRLTVAINSEEGYLSPYTYEHELGAYLFKLVYDSLFTLDENLNPVPWLVKSYTLSQDMTEYTFTLYDNVYFHDGVKLTSKDVKFTYEYLMKYEKSRFTAPAKAITKIEIVNDYTFKMKLSSPQLEFLSKPLSEMGIMPMHLWEKVTDPDNSKLTIGSGPYKLAEVKIGEYYIFEASKNYFRGEAVAKTLFMPIMTNKTAIFTALQSGQIDATNIELLPELVDQFIKNPKMGTVKGAGFTTNLLYFNHERYPFDNKKFREALVKAVNVQEIVNVVLLGAATPGGTGFVHPQLDSYSPNANIIKFNLAEAAAILDGLKFIDRDGDGIRETDTGKKLDFSIITQSTNPTRIRCAELIKEWYGKIGIKVRVEAVDMSLVVAKVWPEYDARKGRDFDMSVFGWGASTMNSVSRYIALWHSDLNKGQSNLKAYKNPQMDAVLDKLATETNRSNVKNLIMQMQDILSRDYAEVMLFYPDLVYAFNKAAHANWVFLKGTGIINHLSLTNVTPAIAVVK